MSGEHRLSLQPRQITVAEAAQMLRYGKKKIRQLIKDGVLKANGRGAGLRITMASIETYLERGESWRDEKPREGQKAAVRSGTTRERGAGLGGRSTKGSRSTSLTLTAKGRRLS